MKYLQLAMIVMVVFSPHVVTGATVTFDFAPCCTTTPDLVASYVCWMRPTGEQFNMLLIPIATVSADSRTFKIHNVDIGNWCFAIAGQFENGEYSNMSEPACITVDQFWEVYELKLKFSV